MNTPSDKSESKEESNCQPWEIHHWGEAFSTNDLARNLAPWSIAVCTVQSNGRGRFNRRWFGEKGGLWVSYTVPLDPSSSINWGHLPLVAGLSLLSAFESLGMTTARLRWPNDVLVGRSKLAGILVERPSSDMAVIGIGVNIHNDIESIADQLQDPPTKLANHVSPCPQPNEIMTLIANHLENLFKTFAISGLDAILEPLARAWKENLPVKILTDDQDYFGRFVGIDSVGNPQIIDDSGQLCTIPAHLINRLVENHS